MDICQLNFTNLDRAVLGFLFDYPTTKFNLRELSRKVKASPTAVSKVIKKFQKKNLVIVKKDFLLEIKLNLTEEIKILKRMCNFEKIYSSDLVFSLKEKFPGAAIILFGSYAFGEDIEKSDIDIAIIGYKEKLINLKKFEKKLKREINLQFFPKFGKISRNLQESLINGIILDGYVEL